MKTAAHRTRPIAVDLAALFTAALFTATLLTACASRRPTVFVTLPSSVVAPPSAATNSVATAPTTAPVLVVRRVGLPEYLDVNAVRYRADASTLAEWPDTAWAERPAVALTRELAARLRVALPGWTVCDATCPGGQSGWVVQAEWAPLDYLRAQHTLQAELRFTVLPPGAGATPRSATQRLALPVSPDSASGQVQALATVVDDAAQAIAARLR